MSYMVRLAGLVMGGVCLLMAQTRTTATGGRTPGAAAEAPAAAGTPAALGVAYMRENYSKYEFKIPMRDGVKLFTAVYIPKDVASEGKTYPILLERTPYTV